VSSYFLFTFRLPTFLLSGSPELSTCSHEDHDVWTLRTLFFFFTADTPYTPVKRGSRHLVSPLFSASSSSKGLSRLRLLMLPPPKFPLSVPLDLRSLSFFVSAGTLILFKLRFVNHGASCGIAFNSSWLPPFLSSSFSFLRWPHVLPMPPPGNSLGRFPRVAANLFDVSFLTIFSTAYGRIREERSSLLPVL